ncbi:MAG: EamA family transporter [Pseudomonadota bacterium]
MSGLLMMGMVILCSAGASFCLKLGASGQARGLLDIALQPMVIFAAVLYAASFGAYALALQKIPLTLAQPVITAGVSIVSTLIAVAVLHETMSRANWCGLVLVCVGIALLSAGKT